MVNQKKKLIIIDSNSVIHRAYHALPSLTTKKGELVNAVYGFLLVFLKAVKDFQPDFIVSCFDYPGITFRHKKFKEYKAKRPPAPEELYQQIPKIKELLESFNIPILEKEGFEADDVISTIVALSRKKQILPKMENIILSGDSDVLQLIDSETKVYLLRRGVKDAILYGRKQVQEKFQGLSPRQILDFKALRGDPSDNIPGVTGVGEKTAVELLLEFGNLENLYKEIEKNSKKIEKIKLKTKETLLKYKEQAFLSKELAEPYKKTPVEFDIKECRWKEYSKERVIQKLKDLEFYSLIKRLPENSSQEEDPIGGTLKLW
jgi:DNA polymerase-1